MARVVVDVPLAHLDRPFDYGVPEKFDGTRAAGCRVRVRFHGRLVDGVVWELADTTDFAGTPAALSHVPSGEPVLTPQVARLARVVADRYAGTRQRRPAAGAAAPARATPRSGPRRPPTACPAPPDPPASPAIRPARRC